MAEALTIMFWPESAYGPTNQCIGLAAILRERGHRIVFAAESSWAGQAGAVRVRRGTRRPRRASRGRRRRGPRQVLDRLHRRDGAGVPQADRRAAGELHPADLSGAHRRREVLRAAAARDHRRTPARRHRRGQRGALPGAGDRRGAVRADRLLQPAGGLRAGRAAAVLRAAQCRPLRMGRLPRRVRPHPPGDVGRVQRLGAGAGRRGAAGAGVHAARQRREPLRLSGRGRLHRRPPAGRQLDPDGFQRPGDRRRVRAARPARRPTRGQRTGLSVAGLPRRRGRRADAAAGRRPRHHPPPVHRQQGTTGRPNHAGRQHGWRADGAADQGHPAGRPGDLARRQQHRHRDAALRQAADRAAAVLGPVRKRPAHRRTRASGCG